MRSMSGTWWPGTTANWVGLARTASYSSTVKAIFSTQAPSGHSQLKLTVAGVSPAMNCSATSATRSFTSRKRASLAPRRSSRAPIGEFSGTASDVARFGVGDRGRRPLTNRYMGSIVQTEDVFRRANEEIADLARKQGWRFPVPFLCECADRHCFARLELTLEV